MKGRNGLETSPAERRSPGGWKSRTHADVTRRPLADFAKRQRRRRNGTALATAHGGSGCSVLQSLEISRRARRAALHELASSPSGHCDAIRFADACDVAIEAGRLHRERLCLRLVRCVTQQRLAAAGKPKRELLNLSRFDTRTWLIAHATQ